MLIIVATAACQEPRDPAVEPEVEPGAEEAEPELAAYMSSMQRWSHKLILSTHAENLELSAFYLHEMEETSATIQAEVLEYEGFPISELMGVLLAPQIEGMHAVLEQRDWADARAATESLVTACNQCHAATDHGFIRISADPLPNPYNQIFTAQPE